MRLGIEHGKKQQRWLKDKSVGHHCLISLRIFSLTMRKSVRVLKGGGGGGGDLSSRSEHGHTLFAYCHIKTNQVLYSLTRMLRNSHLKQLADAGANNNPPKIRKDLWRPLFTVHLPPTAHGQEQGLELFRQLREYRMLHETSWELPEEIKRPYTEKEIEEMQKELDDRGGSKKETVYDVIKRKKKRMRQNMVMDQKANSVADLAQILDRLGQRGEQIVVEKEAAERQDRVRTVAEIVDLAKRFDNGETEDVHQQVSKLQQQAVEEQTASKDKQNTVKERKAADKRRKLARRKAEELSLLAAKMSWSSEAWIRAKEEYEKDLKEGIIQPPPKQEEASASAVSDDVQESTHEETSQEATTQQAAIHEATTQEATAQGATAQEATIEDTAAEDTAFPGTAEQSPRRKHRRHHKRERQEREEREPSEPIPESALPTRNSPEHYLPSFPPELDPVSASKLGYPWPNLSIPRGLQRIIKTLRSPIFTNDGVLIEWANFLDAEYNPEWPDPITHRWMGFVRHSVPVKGMEPVQTVAEFKSRGWKRRQRALPVEENMKAEEVQEGEAEAQTEAATEDTSIIHPEEGKAEAQSEAATEGSSVVRPKEAEVAKAAERKQVLEELKAIILKEVRTGYRSQWPSKRVRYFERPDDGTQKTEQQADNAENSTSEAAIAARHAENAATEAAEALQAAILANAAKQTAERRVKDSRGAPTAELMEAAKRSTEEARAAVKKAAEAADKATEASKIAKAWKNAGAAERAVARELPATEQGETVSAAASASAAAAEGPSITPPEPADAPSAPKL